MPLSSCLLSSKLRGIFPASMAPLKQPNKRLKTESETFLPENVTNKNASPSIDDVQPGRIRVLREGNPSSKGPVIYWMFRDQRSRDNWALIHAVHHANRIGAPVAVAFNLFDQFLGAKARQLGFMLRGLRELEQSLNSLQIPFFLFEGEAKENISDFLNQLDASLLVTDFSPLRDIRRQKDEMCEKLSNSIAVHEVDAHNVVPVWAASDKLEYSARTIRTKIHRLLPEYLIEFPELRTPCRKWGVKAPSEIGWDNLIANVLRKGAEVPELQWCEPGERAAMEVLMGSKNGFLTTRLKNYSSDRNNPLKTNALSGLSPYLHFGQISAHRCALEAHKFRKLHPQNAHFKIIRIVGDVQIAQKHCLYAVQLNKSHLKWKEALDTKAVDVFLEEMIVRRELADNFCFYRPQYDTLQGAWEWARKTLMDHAADKREHVYTREQMEKAKTADPLWNASQLEMVHHGKMHGFMRMYWAKKILEWTSDPEEALSVAISLNDKYQIDGRDPNGYVGCMWSICGVHDQGWQERPIFGKIRYMNYAGCKRKFDVDGYIAYVKRLVGEAKNQNLGGLSNFIAKKPKT